MTLTDAARKRLTALLPKESGGFEVQGYLGTCRGSTPILKPVSHPDPDYVVSDAGGISFFIKPEIFEFLRDCTLDYDPSFFGKGLTMVRSHQHGCACDQ